MSSRNEEVSRSGRCNRRDKYRDCTGTSILFVVMVIGLLMAILLPNASQNQIVFGRVMLALYGLGFSLFLLAKLSVLRQGLWMSFGSDHMSPWYRWLYRIGYCLMGLGFFFTMALVVVQSVIR